MNAKIYITKNNELFITSRIEEWERKIQLKIFPDLKFKLVDISENNKLRSVTGITYDMVSYEDFVIVNNIIESYSPQELAIYESNIITSPVIFCSHLLLGDMINFELRHERLKNVERISFLSLKSFKGKIINNLIDVKHLVVWEDKKSIMNDILKRFPNLESLYLVRTSLEFLDLSVNKSLLRLELHDCRKLNKLEFGENIPENIVIELCPNLIL
jgi:hypothetical protein